MKYFILISSVFISVLSYGQVEFRTVSGCSIDDYVVADTISSIAFSGGSYTPKCLKILIGSEVTVSASKRHPLFSQGVNPLNPITATETTKSFEFNDPGFFGYFCDKHGDASGSGMAGSIWVVESL